MITFDFNRLGGEKETKERREVTWKYTSVLKFDMKKEREGFSGPRYCSMLMMKSPLSGNVVIHFIKQRVRCAIIA